MTREEIYKMCGKVLEDERGNISGYKQYVLESFIDAIIDCAVEEAIKAMKGEER